MLQAFSGLSRLSTQQIGAAIYNSYPHVLMPMRLAAAVHARLMDAAMGPAAAHTAHPDYQPATSGVRLSLCLRSPTRRLAVEPMDVAAFNQVDAAVASCLASHGRLQESPVKGIRIEGTVLTGCNQVGIYFVVRCHHTMW
jgi:hypothetical protein